MTIADIQDRIQSILRRYGVTQAGIFGSFARNEASENSDVDILITLQKPIGVFALARLQRELADAIGRPVDLVTSDALNPRISPYVQADIKSIAV
ncbi:MAG TPA: nucleotidyltransferase family protein [Candidatus Paceibacterota bacterium]